MLLNVLRFASVFLTSIGMAGGLAHAFELRAKMRLSQEDYRIVQQIYRGWAFLGVAVLGGLASTVALALQLQGRSPEFGLTLAAAVCIALTLVVFFIFTFPANRQTANWTVLPQNWQQLRRRWEYSHAASAGLYIAAFVLLVLSLLAAIYD